MSDNLLDLPLEIQYKIFHHLPCQELCYLWLSPGIGETVGKYISDYHLEKRVISYDLTLFLDRFRQFYPEYKNSSLSQSFTDEVISNGCSLEVAQLLFEEFGETDNPESYFESKNPEICKWIYGKKEFSDKWWIENSIKYDMTELLTLIEPDEKGLKRIVKYSIEYCHLKMLQELHSHYGNDQFLTLIRTLKNGVSLFGDNQIETVRYLIDIGVEPTLFCHSENEEVLSWLWKEGYLTANQMEEIYSDEIVLEPVEFCHALLGKGYELKDKSDMPHYLGTIGDLELIQMWEHIIAADANKLRKLYSGLLCHGHIECIDYLLGKYGSLIPRYLVDIVFAVRGSAKNRNCFHKYLAEYSLEEHRDLDTILNADHWFSGSSDESDEWMPIMEMVYKNIFKHKNSEVLDWLINKEKIDVNQLFHYAVYYETFDLLQILIERYPDFNGTVRVNHVPSERLLELEDIHQFTLHYIGNHYNNDPKNEDIPNLKKMVQRPNNKYVLRELDIAGYTYHDAAEDGDVERLEWLQTVPEITCYYGEIEELKAIKPEIIIWLKDHGFKEGLYSQGIKLGNIEILEELEEAECNFDDVTLSFALQTKNREVLEFIFSKGHISLDSGKDLLKQAMRDGNPVVLDWIVDKFEITEFHDELDRAISSKNLPNIRWWLEKGNPFNDGQKRRLQPIITEIMRQQFLEKNTDTVRNSFLTMTEDMDLENVKLTSVIKKKAKYKYKKKKGK